ncbi:MAG: hypothetical protein GY694_05970, partial [Gammaproteobacteria bacterium]|nr:hypothetical protein [Gammaproteobacteria bacterium]
MLHLNNIRIKPKLISLFLLIGLLPLFLVGWYALQQSEEALLKTSFNQLSAVRDIKKSQIKAYFSTLEQNVIALDKTVSNVLGAVKNKMEAVSSIKKAQLEAYFGERYGDIKVLASNAQVVEALTDFTHEIESNNGLKSTDWEALNQQYNDWFTQYVKGYGYYDLFLISVDGNVVYTQAKESDLGENLKTGTLKNSGLAKVFHKSMDKASLVDFEPYAPSNGAHSSFIGAPVVKNGVTIGVVALQMPTDAINSIVQRRDGMDKSAENYLVGELDGVTALRSERTVKKGKIGDPKKGGGISKALNGETASGTKTGSSGDLELVYYTPLDIEGLNWVLIGSGAVESALTASKNSEGEDFFTEFMKINGYYDLFLIGDSGHVFYSV